MYISNITTANHKCVYNNCSKSNKSSAGIAFFKFPVRNPTRVTEWLRNCGNAQIQEMEIHTLGNKLICEEHFLPGDITINDKRKLLTRTAVPIRYVPKSVLQEEMVLADPVFSAPTGSGSNSIRTYGRKHKPNKTMNMSSNDFEVFNECETSKPSVSDTSFDDRFPSVAPHFMTISKRNKLKLRPLRKTKESFSARATIACLMKYTSQPAKTFVNMQLFHRDRSKWSRAEKDLATALYYVSPKSYAFMLYNLKFNLPPIKIIRAWLKLSKRTTLSK